jgi:hypothetical protein
LLHRWLGARIANFEPIIAGDKSGFIDVGLISRTTNELVGFSGLWRALAEKNTLSPKVPSYTLTAARVWRNLEKTDEIIADQTLTNAERRAAIEALSKD